MTNGGLSVAFIHPDLGIGGAERVVVDAAVCLKSAGHTVRIFTGHHDRNYCFDATRNGTLDVRVGRSPIPAQIGGRLRACCALARAAHLVTALARAGSYDVVFCDLVPHVIPLVRRLTRAKVVYYCHYPESDPDGAPKPPANLFYRLYRKPVDRLERNGLAAADRILANSSFTAERFRRAYPGLETAPVEVLYPGVDPRLYEALDDGRDGRENGLTLLSINRFVRFKNLTLALEALALARAVLPREKFAALKLVLAGAYDVRLAEMREVVGELKGAAARLGLQDHVVFRPSCSEGERLELLSRCLCLLYTPDQEHFGIVPLEAMAAGRPVVAVKSGGPMETIVDGETGLLCAPKPSAFADAIVRLANDRAAAGRMGRAGAARVRERFSLARFGQQLEAVIEEVAGACGREAIGEATGAGDA